MQPSLPGVPYESDADHVLTLSDITILLSSASCLAFGESSEERRIAFEVISRIAELRLEADPALASLVIQLAARLGNFPAVEVVKKRLGSTSIGSLGVSSDLEMLSRRIENAFPFGQGELVLTDFQAELLSRLGRKAALSVSAPTSAGKSFVFLSEIVSRVLSKEAPHVAYVVPTRALIRQVTHSLRSMLHTAGCDDVPIRCIPVPFEEESRNGSVYVLTQERLISLLNSDLPTNSVLTLLFIDEAQGVGRSAGARGILLQTAVDEVRLRFPNCCIRFGGPMIENPEYLLGLFALADSGEAISEEESPVTQNVIRVERRAGKPRSARFTLVRDRENLDLGFRNLDFALNATSKAKARFALSLPKTSGCTVLYANTPYQAEILAADLASLLNPSDSISQELRRFGDFLREHIHPEYALAHCLPKGVAFHHGSMPSSVREGVEELVAQEKIRFICCTSTLLQGVNLPVRDIVIAKPRKGQTQPMSRIDFLNLAGRAGRMARELHGNVWCIEPADWETPTDEPSGCLTGKKANVIESALSHVLKDGGTLVSRLIEGDALGKQEGVAAAALSKIYTDYIMTGQSIGTSALATDRNRERLLQLESLLYRAVSVNLPRDLVKRNCAIVPSRLENLHQFLMSARDLSKWVPVIPHDQESYERLKRIFRALSRYLSLSQNRQYEYDTWLAKEWIQNRPLKQIIEKKLNRDRLSKPGKKASSVVREVIKEIEDRIRFMAVKNFRAYCDVLHHVVEKRGSEDLLRPAARHFYLFLECGASDTVALNLIGLGLTRTTALLLRKHLPQEAERSSADCLRLLGRLDIGSLRLPWNSVQELSMILGRQLA